MTKTTLRLKGNITEKDPEVRIHLKKTLKGGVMTEGSKG